MKGMENRVTCTRQIWRVEGKASHSKKERPLMNCTPKSARIKKDETGRN